jgi:hypothetical protein
VGIAGLAPGKRLGGPPEVGDRPLQVAALSASRRK